MPKVTEPFPATAAVDEAIRTLSDTAQRRTTEAQRIFSTSNSVVTDMLATNRQLMMALATGMESMLKASFEAQSTLFASGPSMLETMFAGSKTLVGAWPEVVKQYQKATLDAVHASVESTEKLLTPPS